MNACFRDYWGANHNQHTPQSCQSDATSLSTELRRRISALMTGNERRTCLNMDIMTLLNDPYPAMLLYI